MQKKLIIVIVVVAALVLGAGGGYLAARAISNRVSASLPSGEDLVLPPGMPGWDFGPGDHNGNNEGQFPRNGMGRGMFGRAQPDEGYTQAPANLEEAVTQAKAYAARAGDNLVVSSVMEFSNGFYAIVMEKDSSKGAFGMYIPVAGVETGNVIGPVHRWNVKYTSRGVNSKADASNTVSMTDAAAAAQKALDDQKSNGKVDAQGVDFYGYYTFTYQLDGKIAGLISVNGTNSQVWTYNELGAYVSQEEVKE